MKKTFMDKFLSWLSVFWSLWDSVSPLPVCFAWS